MIQGLIAPARKKLPCAAHGKLRNVANAIVFKSGCCSQCVAFLRDWQWTSRPNPHALHNTETCLKIA